MSRAALQTIAGLVLPIGVIGALLVGVGVMNAGQVVTWLAFFASLTAGLAFLAAMQGRATAWEVGKAAFVVQWAALLAGAAFLWWILFNHQFQYQYVASYSSRAMPGYYVYAAFWGGQEGTFLLWAFITASLGLVAMRQRNPLLPGTMALVSLPLIMLLLVSVMRGPFLMFPPDRVPVDGQGLNPLLQDWWMTIHPPVLFIGFSSLVMPFAIAVAALVRRDYDGWVKTVLPWVAFSTAILATGFIMGGVWAYKVLGWGGYWGWDPVENGSLIPWLANIALLHGLLVQRVTGSLRRTNFFLAVTSYVLVLYASFLTRSGVLADFSVHSFANLGLSGFLLSFLGIAAAVGYGLLLVRLRDIPGPREPLGSLSRESFMWLGQLVFMLMCALIAVGMSAPLITRLFGPASNVQTSYYNLVNAPLAVAMGILFGLAPLMRWRKQEGNALLTAATPAILAAVVLTLLGVARGVRQPMPLAVWFAMSFGLASNVVVTVRGFKAGWRHGLGYLSHAGAAILLIGVIASSNYGVATQVQLPKGETRTALGYTMTYEGMVRDPEGKDHAMIAVASRDRNFEANTKFYWSEYNQGYMKKPHIEKFITHDVYISPLEMVGDDPDRGAIWFRKGESRKVGNVTWTFHDFERQMGDVIRLTANLTADVGGRTVPVRPTFEMEMASGKQSGTPGYVPGGGQVTIQRVDPNEGGRVALLLPGAESAGSGEVLAVEVSTKPLINLVWFGSVIMLAAGFLVTLRRALDLRQRRVAHATSASHAAGAVPAGPAPN